jgi:hypothetical protein
MLMYKDICFAGKAVRRFLLIKDGKFFATQNEQHNLS